MIEKQRLATEKPEWCPCYPPQTSGTQVQNLAKIWHQPHHYDKTDHIETPVVGLIQVKLSTSQRRKAWLMAFPMLFPILFEMNGGQATPAPVIRQTDSKYASVQVHMHNG